MFKKSNFVLATTAILALTAPSITTVASANEIDPIEVVDKTDNVKIEKNDLYIALEKELEELTQNNDISTFRTTSTKGISQDQAMYLLEKYDGAEATVTRAADAFSEKFVNGGVNTYATTYTGLNAIRDNFSAAGTLVGGSVGAAAFGGPIGIAYSLFGTPIAAQFLRGAEVASDWIQGGHTSGGVRVTYTDAFAIDNINSQLEAVID